MSIYNNEGTLCECGNDTIRYCEKCKQHSCGKCAVPSLVYTNKGWYCVKCLKGVTLIQTRGVNYEESRCIICKKSKKILGMSIFVFVDKVLCLDCLEKIVKESDYQQSDSDDDY